jgi:hypothetical protein
MTDAAAPQTPPAAAAPARLDTGAWPRVMWGGLLTFLAAALILGGATNHDSDGHPMMDVILVGVAVALVGLPTLLIGIIATGIRVGLEDREAVREWNDRS